MVLSLQECTGTHLWGILNMFEISNVLNALDFRNTGISMKNINQPMHNIQVLYMYVNRCFNMLVQWHTFGVHCGK